MWPVNGEREDENSRGTRKCELAFDCIKYKLFLLKNLA